MNLNLTKTFASLSLLGSILVSCLAVVGTVTTQAACSGDTCSESEEQACTTAYTDCVNEAAAAADRNKCQQCIDSYCKCYDACGNTCDRDKLPASCS